MSRPTSAAVQVGWWPLVLAKGLPAASPWTAPGVVLLDEGSADDDEDLHREWRRWLQLYNTCQFLPGMLLTTASGLDGHDYDLLEVVDLTTLAPGQPAGQAAINGAWQEVLDQSLPALMPGLTRLAKVGAPIPEVGMELADDKGRVLADAELTWVEKRLTLLRPDQGDLAALWQAEAWTVCQLDDSLTSAGGQPWVSMVASILGLELKNNED